MPFSLAFDASKRQDSQVVVDAEFVFPEPWWDLRGHETREVEMAELLTDRLELETAEGHPLYGMSASAVARCTACDHVLYMFGASRFALVHLTWSSTTPDRPPWPSSTLYDSWESAARAVVAHEPDWE